YSYVL
ncbi:hypothetical protein CP8484711_1749C, partial [Chlamydia psittaci 84-8471/1]